MNRSQLALLRKGLVAGSAPQDCPECGGRLEFGTDRLGRTTEYCACGYDALVRKQDPHIEGDSPTMRRSRR